MATVTWTEPALRDLVGVSSFIARNSPSYAQKMATRILRAARRLTKQPQIGWIVPEFELESIREILVGSYRIIYRVDGDCCFIVAVIHGSRPLPREITGRDNLGEDTEA